MKNRLIKLLEDLLAEANRIDPIKVEKEDYLEVVEHLKLVSMSLIVNFRKK